ncbi:MAG: biopolymer transporter ExbD [Deltaproteobacteria bacterium]|nr:biopolymer transporter ExbD [Deltaproteobacteria bacterium]
MAQTFKDDDDEIISDINITPFVDVTLVLLIIFMVTATYIVAQSIPLDLPEAATGEDIVTTLAVSITKDGDLYLDGSKTSEPLLKTSITDAQKTNEDVRVVIAADKQVSHGKVVHIIDVVRQLGISKFAINIDAPQKDEKQ